MAKRILTVDDSASIRSYIRLTLEGAGYGVGEAADVDAALALVALGTFDLVITDFHMPGKTGFDFLRALRATPTTRNLPVVVLTTQGGDEFKREAKEAGASAWMGKPFEPARLLQVVGKLLD